MLKANFSEFVRLMTQEWSVDASLPSVYEFDGVRVEFKVITDYKVELLKEEAEEWGHKVYDEMLVGV